MNRSEQMEKALEAIRDAATCGGSDFGNPAIRGLLDQMDMIRAMAQSALALPRRNCDRFSTFDEAWDCWFNLPSEEIGGDYGIHHFVEWLFSPVTKEGGAK